MLWRGDFSTGNISQWSGTETVGSDRLTVVNSPVAPGEKYSLKTTVQPGDNPTNSAGGNRDELIYETDRPQEGDERYYHWKTMWPADYKTDDYWQIFTQWHQYITGGSPPLAFMAWGEQIKLGNPQTFFWTAPLERGVWHDFVFHVKWSADPKLGSIELWYDGQHVLPPTPVATLYSHDTVYLKQGLYRKDRITWNQTLFHSGMTVATSLADVMPPATATTNTTVSAGTTTESGATTTSGATTPAGSQSEVASGTGTQAVGGCDSSGAATLLAMLPLAALFWRRRQLVAVKK